MPFIQYPKVPNVAGVPQLLRQGSGIALPVLASVAGVAQLVRAFNSKPAWGVYAHIDQGAVGADGLEEVVVVAKRTPAVTPDSFRDFGYDQEWTVTTAPIQKGGFDDYNRVGSAFEVLLRMTKGGSLQDRTDFIKQVESMDSTTLYDVVTPEKTYLGVNLLRVGLKRKGQNGAYWFAAYDVYFREIREVTAQYTKTQITQPQSTSASNVRNNGVQQGTPSTRPVPLTVTQ